MKSLHFKFYLFFFLLVCPCIKADEKLLENSLKELENASQRSKAAANQRLVERTQLLQTAEGLQKEIDALEEKKKNLIKEEKLISKQRQDALTGKNRIALEIRDFNQKFQSAKIEHNMNRPLTVIGAAGFVKELGDVSVKEFFHALTEEEKISGTSQQVEQYYVNEKQEKVKGQLVVVGNLLGYLIEEPKGMLLLSDNTFVATKSLSLSAENLKELKTVQPFGVPFDVSGGGALAYSSENPSVWLRLQDGGVVVYPILAVGLIALTIILIKFFYLSSVSGNVLVLEKKIRDSIVSNQWDDLEAFSRNKKPIVYQLAWSALQKKKELGALTDAYFEEKIYSYIPKLEKMMPTLNILGVIAPLLGLLGTVTGMIATFDVITVHGSGNPGLLSKGISEALITTKLGLMVAIPVILFHSLLSSRIEKNINDLETIANLLVPAKSPEENKL